MKYIYIFFLIFYINFETFAWGFYGHKLIIEKAIYLIPDDSLFLFYKNNIDELEKSSVTPDKRKRFVEEEGPKHFMDMEYYLSKGYTFENLPRDFREIKNKFKNDSVEERGVLLWNITFIFINLRKSFEGKNKEKILKYSGEICHYISDATVPLHTTENYNGQLSNQYGIHGLWETEIPKLNAEKYNHFNIELIKIKDIHTLVIDVIKKSFEYSKVVLVTELVARAQVQNSFKIKRILNTNKVDYSEEFIQKYNSLMGDMVEERINLSIQLTASLINAAWENAGKPLIELDK